MERPSLFLAAQQLKPFIGKTIEQVSGNTKSGKEQLEGKKVLDLFSWGKHLVFQFPTFAVRIHFLLFGSFEATVQDKSVTGDYKKKARVPRLAFTFKNGHMEMYSCSVKFIESANAKAEYDFSVDLMSDAWNPVQALRNVRKKPREEIADVLLDQTIFAGLGNIIKNEILFLAKVKPTTLIGQIPLSKLKELIAWAKQFSLQFYKWRKKFVLRKNLKVHRKGICPLCGYKLLRAKTGKRQRWSYYCLVDQA